MSTTILFILFTLAAVVAWFVLKPASQDKDTETDHDDYRRKPNPQHQGFIRIAATGILAGLGIFCFCLSSFVVVKPDHDAHLNRKIGKDMPTGQIIARKGQKGPQMEIWHTGLKFKLFMHLFYDIEQMPIIKIESGYCGLVHARDGVPLRKKENQIYADKWSVSATQMLDGEYFLGEGKGQAGPQLSTLSPKDYRINQYLFKVTPIKATVVPVGEVLVIKSNVTESDADPNEEVREMYKDFPSIVPKGHKGVWQDVLTPDTYYLNTKAYEVTSLSVRRNILEYKGGYMRRILNLEVQDDGKIVQTVEPVEEKMPSTAADRAIFLRIQGWKVPQEVRVITHTDAEHAPIVVASVGDLQAVEDKVVTPAVRSIVRDVTGSERTDIAEEKEGGADPAVESSVRRVLDLQDRRPQLQAETLAALSEVVLKAGVTVDEVLFGDPVFPPEVLVPRLRKQLASELSASFVEEEKAQKQRIQTENTRAEAANQEILVQAEIEAKAAKARGEGAQQELTAIAQGQEAQANVLGEETTAALRMLEMILKAAQENEGIIKVPAVLVENGGSGGGSSEGAAAVLGSFLGNSNLSHIISDMSGTGAKKPDPAPKKGN